MIVDRPKRFRPVRRHPVDRYTTVASSLVDLTTGEYWLASGNPCTNDYERLPWNLYDGPAGKEARAGELAAAG